MIHLSEPICLCLAQGLDWLLDQAAASKCNLYEDLSQTYSFIPVAVETSGAFGKDTIDF